jgi:hypothetical protein
MKKQLLSALILGVITFNAFADEQKCTQNDDNSALFVGDS